MTENNFLTIQFLISFPGAVLLTVFLAQAFKVLVLQDKTTEKMERVVFVTSLICVALSYLYTLLGGPIEWTGQFVVGMILFYVGNVLFVWFTSMKGYEKILEPYNFIRKMEE